MRKKIVIVLLVLLSCAGVLFIWRISTSDHGTVDFPFGRRAKPSLIHIHINHDLFRGRDFCVKKRLGRRKKAEG